MDKKLGTFALSAILVLALSACNMGGTPTPVNPILPANAVELTVQADPPGPISAVDQTISYTYFIKNTGTESLPGVVSVIGATVNCPAVNTVGNLDEFLDPNETLVCVSSYTTVQADLDAGSITTTTSANVNGIVSNQVTTTVTTTPNRILTLTKSTTPTNYQTVGQTITYNYVVTNSGELAIGPAQFTVTDEGLGSPLNCGNPDTTLAKGQTVNCTATYTITQADIDTGTITTSATASGGGVGPSQPASATVTKNTSNLTPGSNVDHTVIEGEWLWQIARCYGADPNAVVKANPQIPNPAFIKEGTKVHVPNIGSEGTIYQTNPPIPCIAKHTVVAGDTWESIAQKYNADLTVLKMVNKNNLSPGVVLKVPLNSAGGGPVSATKRLTLTTSADLSVYSQLSQIITFTYVIENSGNTSLGPAQFTVSDPLVSATPFNCGGQEITLAPGATVQCTNIYAITAGDLEVLSVTNTATASGGGAPASNPASATIRKSVVGLAVTTAATPLKYSNPGEVITFTYVIRNSGNTTLGPAQFTVRGMFGRTEPINCGPAGTTLAPDQTVTCSYTYTITDADMTVESLLLVDVTASGGGATVSQQVNITIHKRIAELTINLPSASPFNFSNPGEEITFGYIVWNSGNTTLGPAQFTITNSLFGTTPINCGPADTTLIPGATVQCSVKYTVTQADIDAGSITSNATASGGGAETSAPSSITINRQ